MYTRVPCILACHVYSRAMYTRVPCILACHVQFCEISKGSVSICRQGWLDARSYDLLTSLHLVAKIEIAEECISWYNGYCTTINGIAYATWHGDTLWHMKTYQCCTIWQVKTPFLVNIDNVCIRRWWYERYWLSLVFHQYSLSDCATLTWRRWKLVLYVWSCRSQLMVFSFLPPHSVP